MAGTIPSNFNTHHQPNQVNSIYTHMNVMKSSGAMMLDLRLYTMMMKDIQGKDKNTKCDFYVQSKKNKHTESMVTWRIVAEELLKSWLS